MADNRVFDLLSYRCDLWGDRCPGRRASRYPTLEELERGTFFTEEMEAPDDEVVEWDPAHEEMEAPDDEVVEWDMVEWMTFGKMREN